jgi:hypothetical protein
MSLFDDASVVITPSGYKEGKLYSIKPTDGSGDLSVTRATTATRVNSAGLVEVVPYNILTYSNTFTNTNWIKNACTITANSIISPDGTQNASKLVESTANDSHHIYQNAVASGLNTFSFYAKAGERNFVYAYADSVGQGKCFDLQNGTIGANIIAAPTNATITSVGNGWYRCTITLNIASSSALRIGACSANGTFSYLGNGTSGIYIYGAQLVSGTSAKDYLRTETRLNIPRLDYTNGSCPSILVEPQRTNLLTYSEQFNDASWIKTATITANTTIAPDGNLSADTFTDSTNAFLDVRKVITITANSTNTASFFVKKTTGALTNYAGVAILLTGVSTRVDYGIINTTTGAVIRDSSSNINSIIYSTQSYGDYWRVITTFTDNQSNLVCTFILYPAISTNGTSINSNAQGSNVFWGAQLEAGSYATSYIPTVAASVTRNADVISKTGISSLIGQTEGTMFFDLVFPQRSIGSYIGISNGTTANRIILGCESNTFFTFGYSSGTVLSLNVNTRYKIAMAYNSTNMKIYANGNLLTTVTGSVPSGLSRFAFDSGGGSQNLIASVNTCALFKTKLSDSELAQLTTI